MKIFIIDDHSSVRESYKRWLEANNYTVVGDTGDFDNAISLIKKLEPEIVLMDIDFPNSNYGGLELSKKIKEHFNDVKIIFVTHYKEFEIIKEAFAIGANGYFAKEDLLKHLKRILEEVSEGYYSVSPTVLKSIINYFTNKEKSPTNQIFKQLKYILNSEEQKILELISKGLSNKEIANQLNTNEKKIKNEIYNLLIKTGAKNRAELIYITMKDGLLK